MTLVLASGIYEISLKGGDLIGPVINSPPAWTMWSGPTPYQWNVTRFDNGSYFLAVALGDGESYGYVLPFDRENNPWWTVLIVPGPATLPDFRVFWYIEPVNDTQSYTIEYTGSAPGNYWTVKPPPEVWLDDYVALDTYGPNATQLFTFTPVDAK